MKSISIIIGLMLIFSLNFVVAQEIVTEEEVIEAGVTPDSPFYNLEMIFEGFTEMFGENIKIKHAQERLSEMKVMIASNKMVQAQIASQNFEKVRLKLRNQSRLEEHRQLVNNLGEKISAIASTGKLSEQERTQIKNLIQNHKEKIDEEIIGIIAQARNINLEQAEQIRNQERERIQSRITDQVKQRVQNLNNQGGN